MKTSNYIAKPNSKISLSKFSTKDISAIKSKDDGKELLEKNIEKMIELQNKLYASDKHSVLLIFQAMDAVSYTHLRAHETVLDLVCRLLLEKKKNTTTSTT